MGDEYTQIFQFIKESKNPKLWSHWHAFPAPFSNTFVCPSHIVPQPVKVQPSSCFSVLGNISGLVCHKNRAGNPRAVEKNKEKSPKLTMMNLGFVSLLCSLLRQLFGMVSLCLFVFKLSIKQSLGIFYCCHFHYPYRHCHSYY